MKLDIKKDIKWYPAPDSEYHKEEFEKSQIITY